MILLVVRACARVCVRANVCVCVRVCVFVCVYVSCATAVLQRRPTAAGGVALLRS